MINLLNEVQIYRSVKGNIKILENKIPILEKDLEQSKVELENCKREEELLKLSIDLQCSELNNILETTPNEEKENIIKVLNVVKINLGSN